MRPGIDVDDDYQSPRRADNQWLQDRTAMARGESYSGLGGLTLEDVAIGESQGRIRSRAGEHLGPTDIAIAHVRQVYLQAVADVAAGGLPRGASVGEELAELRSRTGLLESGRAWSDVTES